MDSMKPQLKREQELIDGKEMHKRCLSDLRAAAGGLYVLAAIYISTQASDTQLRQ
jgi:hypothetical protein